MSVPPSFFHHQNATLFPKIFASSSNTETTAIVRPTQPTFSNPRPTNQTSFQIRPM